MYVCEHLGFSVETGLPSATLLTEDVSACLCMTKDNLKPSGYFSLRYRRPTSARRSAGDILPLNVFVYNTMSSAPLPSPRS